MPLFFRHRTKASELQHNDLSGIGPSDHHTKYTDAEAVAAAKADADIADAITKKHTQNTDTKLDEGGSNEISAAALNTPWNDEGLVLYLPFDENTGTTAEDKSHHDNDGTFRAAGEPAWSEGHKNCGVDFDGVDDYIEVPDDPTLDGMSNLTVEAWVKSNDVSKVQRVVSKMVSPYSYSIVIVSNATPSFQLYTSGGHVSAPALATVLTANKWYHFVLTYDGAHIRFFINGVEDANSPWSLTGTVNDSPGAVYIGWETATTQYMDGLIDEVRIYNRALSAEEVKMHYLRG